jgi:mono/diheme cytochrome c family protein
MRASACAGIAGAAVIAAAAILLPKAHADSQLDRGKYLVVVASCNDCHTPGFFLGKPDTAKYLGGSDVGFEIPGLGVFAGRNITPDKETGIGSWTDEQIATAITAGKRPDGRQLAPIMPYASFSYMTKEDVAAVVAFLRSIPPVKNEVAGPFKPGDKVSIFTFRVLPPGEMAMAAPK